MLNIDFERRMKLILGDEYESFSEALERSAVKGVRVNMLKCDAEAFAADAPLNITPLPYASDGFILNDTDGIGNTPEHHAGMIYVQDPGAMATVCAVDIEDDFAVCDLCSAPGGKSGQIAARIPRGFLLSNEYVPKRAKIVVSNFERLGVRRAVVTSLDTAEIARLFKDHFDLVIADVPCSGEGMFRKYDEAIAEWSEENVRVCAERQTEIIRNAAKIVRPGGRIIYSTCTYSLEENEKVIDGFLAEFPEFSLVPVKRELIECTKDGIAFDGARSGELHHCRRFYPHVSEGEGQFIAVLKRADGESKRQTVLYADSSKKPSRDEEAAVMAFFKDTLTEIPEGKLIKVGENLVFSEHGMPIPPRSVFSAGVLVGEIRGKLLFPSHQFFSAYGKLFKRQENLLRGDERVTAYLRGEEIEAREVKGSGFTAVLYEGTALGGGKTSGGVIKNHYPKGLRIKG